MARTAMGSDRVVVIVSGALLALTMGVAVVVLVQTGPAGLPSQLLEIDGIPLDSNAAAALQGAGRAGRSSAISMHLSHMNGKSIDKLLTDNEKGEIDGIALDSHAMAELGGGSTGSSSLASHAAQKKAKASSQAQRLLDEGKQELDSHKWKAAVKLFSRAKLIWERAGNDQYHWAASLEHDVLRLHPGAKSAAGQSTSTRQSGTGGQQQMDVRKAVKQLSSGHQFRSLYGLLRDQHAMTAAHKGETMAQKAVAEAAKVISPYRSLMAAPARTQSLSQTKSKPSSQMDAVILQAEKDLKRKGKMELLHEKATIVKMARELANVAATKSARSEVRLGNPPASLLQGQPEGEPQQLAQAPEQSWSSSTGPAGQQAQWSIMQGQSLSAQEPAPEAEVGQVRPLSEYVRRQSNEMHRRLAFPANEQHLPIVEKVHNALMRRLPAAAEKAIDAHQAQTSPYDEPPYNRFHARGRFHYDLDQVQPRYPSYAPPFPPQQPQSVEKQPSSPLEMREQVSGKNKVPVININLPNGQVVPPGQYYMDGSLVEDLAGHWDYVGKLVPSSPRESAV